MAKTQTTRTDQGQIAARQAATQQGALADAARESPATKRLVVLQGKADATIQRGKFGDFLERRAATKAYKKAQKRGAKGGLAAEMLLGDGENEYEDNESSREEEAHVPGGGGDGAGRDWDPFGFDDLSEEHEAEEGANFKWESDDVERAMGADAFVLLAKRFHKNVRVVLPEEWGGSSFATLKASLQNELDEMPMVDEGQTHDGAPLLRNVQGGQKVGSEKTSEDDPESENANQAQERLRKIIGKVRGKLGRLSDDHQEVAMVALVMAQKEIEALLAEHKSWRSTLMAMGAGGPAGYLEDKILPVVLSNMATHLKEFVPMSKGRKARDKISGVGEGVLDIGWNAASLGVEALTFGAAAAGTSAVGASYKMGLAGASAKRAGSGDDKAVAQAVVTFVLEFLQGLIPFAGSALGITGGARGIYKTINPRKLLARRGGYGTLRDADSEPDVFAMLLPRIERGEELRSRGEGMRGSAKLFEAKLMIEQDLEWLERQLKKVTERQKGGGGGWPGGAGEEGSFGDDDFFSD